MKWTFKTYDLSKGLKVSRVFACVISQGSEFGYVSAMV